jgi:uncharacterized protein YbjT (DUF2867 family)
VRTKLFVKGDAMKILVSGGTGHLGSAIAARLCATAMRCAFSLGAPVAI